MKKIPLIKTAWKRALLEIYFKVPSSWTEDSNCNRNTGNHPLQEKLGISNNQQFAECIGFLEEQKLIETKREQKYSYWVLKEKGFDVALGLQKQVREIRGEIREDNRQFFIICLTTILASTSMISFTKEIFPQLKDFIFWGYLILMGILVFSMSKRLRKR